MKNTSPKTPPLSPATGAFPPGYLGRPILDLSQFFGFRSFLSVLALWHDRSCQRRQLAQLDESLLADIGKSREEARQECRKPFWR
jgi:uncharacterized protein YjiS (DUF1127 family)